MAGTKKIFASKNQFCHANELYKGIFEVCIVFSHFFLQELQMAPQNSNFVKKCPKLGAGTHEDILFTNLDVAT